MFAKPWWISYSIPYRRAVHAEVQPQYLPVVRRQPNSVQKPIIWQDFFRKLHENEMKEIGPGVGRLDPPMLTQINFMFLTFKCKNLSHN